MSWAAIIAAVVEAFLKVILGEAKATRDDQDKVDQGRAEVKAEVDVIVKDAADAQASVNQQHRDPRAVAERLLREAGVDPASVQPSGAGPAQGS